MTFKEFVRSELPGLVGFATVMRADSAQGEDVMQQVFCRYGQRWSRIGQLEHPTTYARPMMGNELLGWRRKSGPFVPVSEVPIPSVADPTTAGGILHLTLVTPAGSNPVDTPIPEF